MQTDWGVAIEFVLKEEGGYTLDPNDTGGETNFGISKRRYPNEDIKNMTEERARELYKKDFWQKLRCDELPSPLAIAVFDAAVNQGESGAGRMLQVALQFKDTEADKIDGLVGEATVTASHKFGPNLLRRFMAQRMARYIRTILNKPTQEVFCDNWSGRLMRLAEIVFKGPVNIA